MTDEERGEIMMALLDYTIACQTGMMTIDAMARENAKGETYRALWKVLDRVVGDAAKTPEEATGETLA